MKQRFEQLEGLPTPDILPEITALGLDWGPSNQICINTVEPGSDDYQLGTGSLKYDWANKRPVTLPDGSTKWEVPEYSVQYDESDFQYLVEIFQGTLIESVYGALVDSGYKLGRIRLMRNEPKTCLSWHVDTSPRLHFPVKTHTGCFMVIEDEVRHLPERTWWMTNTTLPHTAFNASRESRIHLVACILNKHSNL